MAPPIQVHVYRLVTPGTIEERIHQRAEKKLYLDKMVNRDGDPLAATTQEGDAEGSEDGDEPSGSELLTAITFGSQAIFSSEGGKGPTDDEIDAIIDRTRTENDNYGNLKGGAVQSTDQFDAELAMMNLRELQGTVYEKSSQKSFQNCKAVGPLHPFDFKISTVLL